MANDSTKLRVLLAEDDPNDLFFISRAFGVAGIEVDLEVAKDGQEAIEHLQRTTSASNGRDRAWYPDVLVLDLKMPRLNGFQVLEWVRQQFDWRGLPVVVLSSSNLPEDVEHAYALGADLYEVKPNDPAKMIDLVRRLGKLFNRAARSANEMMVWG